jgi:hypothetical protein
MYALSVGIQNVSESLPGPVYALLSGLNAATVGIVAVSAVQLAEKAIQDKVSRILVIFGACAGLCYNTLWYFPVLMLIGGLTIAVWDGWLFSLIHRTRLAWKNRHRKPADPEETNIDSTPMDSISPGQSEQNGTLRSRKVDPGGALPQSSGALLNSSRQIESEASQQSKYSIRVRTGVAISIIFFGIPPKPTAILKLELTMNSFLHRNSCR